MWYNLYELSVTNCHISGTISLYQYSNMNTLRLENNNFTGNLPQLMSNMVYYYASNNQFTGYTSATQRVTSSQLYQLDFSNNYLNTNEINKVLADLSGITRSSGNIYLGGTNMGYPTGKGILAIDYLTPPNRSWSVTVTILYVYSGETYSVDPTYNCLNFIYAGTNYTNATISASGTSYTISNSGNSFVWDLGGGGQHTFTYGSETITRSLNGTNFTIEWDSGGSGYFFIKIRKSP